MINEPASTPIQPKGSKSSWLVAKDLKTSFIYAFQGLAYSLKTQRNFRIHILMAIIVSILAVWLQLPLYDLAILALTITAVLVLELLNTSIEAVVDLAIGKSFHPLAKIAKDCSAASVLVASICSLVIGLFLLLPPLLSHLVN